jgi:hypothetical protein
VGFVWSSGTRRQAFDRIQDELGIKEDPRPELSGVILVVTAIGSRGRNLLFLAFRVALLAALVLGAITILGAVRDNARSLAFAGLMAVCYQVVLVFSVGYHVMFAAEDRMVIVRVSPLRYIVKRIVVDESPPLGRLEFTMPLVPQFLPETWRYRRPEGDLYFHMSSWRRREATDEFLKRVFRPRPPHAEV